MLSTHHDPARPDLEKTTRHTAKIELPASVVDRLLEELSTSNDFRRLFRKDRHAALAQLCGELTAEELRVAAPFRCLGVERLASKKQIAAARSELQRYLTSKGGYTIPHCLDASAMRSTS